MRRVFGFHARSQQITLEHAKLTALLQIWLKSHPAHDGITGIVEHDPAEALIYQKHNT